LKRSVRLAMLTLQVVHPAHYLFFSTFLLLLLPENENTHAASPSMKLRTIRNLDWHWAFKFAKKRGYHPLSYLASRLSARSYWEATFADGLTLRFGFITPYHHATAKNYAHGSYEPAVLRWQEEAKRHFRIYDIGGFSGLYGLVAAKSNPRAIVTIFEPHPTNAEQCRRNITLNNLSNCSVEELAVSNETATATFTREATTGAHFGGPLIVKTTTLDDLPPPDLMKIDVEGAEGDVIDGAHDTLLSHPAILLEQHAWLQNPEKM
jgi:FkbM family methyltransferase